MIKLWQAMLIGAVGFLFLGIFGFAFVGALITLAKVFGGAKLVIVGAILVLGAAYGAYLWHREKKYYE